MLGKLFGHSPNIQGPGFGLNVNPESDQFRNLIVHLPLMEYPTSVGYPLKFRDTKHDFAGWVFNGNNDFSVAKHPKREFYCPRLFGLGAGNSSTGIGVGLVQSGPSFVYGTNSKTHYTPKRFTVTIWIRINAFTNFLVNVVGEKLVFYNAPYNNWMMRYLNNGTMIWDCTDGTNSNIGQMSSSSGLLSLSTDYLLGLTVDGEKLRGYLNGVEIMNTPFTATIGAAASSLTIGNNPQQLFQSETHNGYIWDYRMYNKALSKNEHLDLYKHPYALYERSKKIVRVPSLGSEVLKSVTSNFTVTDNYSKSLTSTRALSHSVIVAQLFGQVYNKALTQSVSTSDTISKTIGRFTLKSITQFFAATDSISRRFARLYSITHSVATSQLALNDRTSISHSFTVTDSITYTKDIRLSVSQSFNVADIPFVQSPQIFTLNHNLICTQTLAFRNATTRLAVTQSFIASDVVFGRNATTRISVVQAFTTSQNVIIRDAIVSYSLSNSITLVQRINTAYPRRIEHDINIADSLISHKHIYRTWSTDTVVNTDFTVNRTINRTFSTTDNVVSTINRQVIYNRTLETVETIIAEEFHPAIQFNTRPFYLPDIPGGPPQFGLPSTKRSAPSGIEVIAPIVRIFADGNVLTLPQPQLANTLADSAEVTSKRAISGELVSYKKTTGQEAFSYTFWLDRPKAIEVRQWVKLYGSKTLKIINWRGETWQGNLITDQPTLEYDSVRVGPAGEKVVITLEFQGVKLYG